MSSIIEQFRTLWDQAVPIWIAGGWAMPPIAVIAFAMFGMGVHVLLNLRATGFLSTPEARWREWLSKPQDGAGPIGRLVRNAVQSRSLKAASEVFDEVRAVQSGAFERDLRVMKICVSAAPLVGLLGTVTGMLATFEALASGSGGEKTMSMIAAGISEALITTETGLVIALPGLFFQYHLSRQFERYKAYLAHMETVCSLVVYRSQGAGAQPSAV
jgi:biopolymer transport protein ExbB